MLKPTRDRREAIWQALEEGDIEQALALAARLNPPSDDLEGRLLVAIVQLEAGHARTAYQLLRSLEGAALTEDDEFARRSNLAQAAYALGQPEEALGLLEHLQATDPREHANLMWCRGLCHDHLGRSTRADRCFERAAELDPEGASLPVAIQPEEVETIVARVAAELPPELRAALHELPVVIQDLPGLALVRGSAGEVHPDTLGLYVGTHLLERSHLGPAEDPPAIYIYRRNLERFVTDRAALEEEIRNTLLHEFGHHLGYDEDDLDALGLA